MIKKILGYVLLAIGLILIVFALWQSYNIFYGKASAPFLFITPVADQNQQATQIFQVISQEQIEKAIQQQIGQYISSGDITKILNLLSWSLFASILIIAGGAISLIGVKLINGSRIKQ